MHVFILTLGVIVLWSPERLQPLSGAGNGAQDARGRLGKNSHNIGTSPWIASFSTARLYRTPSFQVPMLLPPSTNKSNKFLLCLSKLQIQLYLCKCFLTRVSEGRVHPLPILCLSQWSLSSSNQCYLMYFSCWFRTFCFNILVLKEAKWFFL